MIRRILASSRFVIAFAVLGSFLAAASLIFYGFFTVFEIVWDMISEHSVSAKGAKFYAVEFIELIDLFLLGTVLYIVALGLYELFIDQDLPVPKWLHIATLDDLKEKLIGVIIVLLGVTFLGAVGGSTIVGVDILYMGLAIAAVIVALTLQRWLERSSKEKEEE